MELMSSPASSECANGTGVTVLLVEDDQGVRELISLLLTLQGHTVLEAGDGQQALRLASEYKGTIQLLMADVVMPGMDGFQLAAQLRARNSELRVLFMSGYTDDVVERHGSRRDEVQLLDKPFTLEVLNRKLQQVLS